MKKLIKDYELLWKQLFFVLIDVISIMAASFGALVIRFDFKISAIDPVFLGNVVDTMPVTVLVTLVIYWAFKLYRSVWQYAGLYEFQHVIFAVVTSTLLHAFSLMLFQLNMPRSYWFLFGIFLGSATLASRFFYRALRLLKRRIDDKAAGGKISRVMIVGAGAAGESLIREIVNSNKINKKIMCLIDDNPDLLGLSVRGVTVIGGREMISSAAHKYGIDEIMIALPSAPRAEVAKIANICNQTGCELKIVPGMYQVLNREVSVSRLRNVEIEDLLGREPVELNLDSVKSVIKDQTVLVTGGGGSIGSELCRQIAAMEPRQLIIVDIYENNAYEIQQELIRKFPRLNLVVLIASVRNTNRINSIMETYLPNIVFHAAAHKHVPLMETSPNEAIKNNVFGTLKTVQAAARYGVERFVLISTDKAVNPTNIMGASKRICEMIIQAYSRMSDTRFVAVRFGNVLGSNGSVIPLFKKQIQEGGPVTVTHPDIIRYFMTIPEAVSLVLEAGAYANGGEIFVLDMGEPVKIDDLAKNLIKLSGLTPNEDIMIEYTGLRPGEKLYEERLMAEEGLERTANDRISIAKPIEMDDEKFFRELTHLQNAVYDETGAVREMVSNIVPTYKVAKVTRIEDIREKRES